MGQETQWHRLVAWGNLAERLERTAKKGSELAIQGKLKYGSYEDKNGQTREYAEIVINEFMVTGGRKEKEVVTEENGTQPF